MPSIVVVVVPLVLGFLVGNSQGFLWGFVTFFAASWVLGVMWQKSRGQW